MAAITAGIVALATAAANDAVPSVKELTEAARGMREAMDEAKATYDDTVTSTMAAAGVADTYIGKLEELEAAGLNTDEQHRQYHNTLALLCQVVPELADYIDLETDTINGGTEALRANTEAWKQNAMQQAYQDQLTELYSQYSAVLIEAEENSIGLTKAQYSLEAAQQKLSDTYAQMDALWADAQKQADAYPARPLIESFAAHASTLCRTSARRHASHSLPPSTMRQFPGAATIAHAVSGVRLSIMSSSASCIPQASQI